MHEAIRIRTATEADAPALAEIYRPFVEETAVSFESVAPPRTSSPRGSGRS